MSHWLGAARATITDVGEDEGLNEIGMQNSILLHSWTDVSPVSISQDTTSSCHFQDAYVIIYQQLLTINPFLIRSAQLSSGGHVLLAGDFNARVGAASQPWVTELGEGISAQLQNRDITVNGHGCKLLCLCEEAAMVSCTGRTAGDTPAQPSFKPRSNTEPSRLEHALVDCGLFPAVQTCTVGPYCWLHSCSL